MSAAEPSLIDRARRVLRPTIFWPGLPSAPPCELASLAAVRAELQAKACGAALTFRLGRAAYPEFEAFASITAYADGVYLATVGGPWAAEAEQRAAAEALQ